MSVGGTPTLILHPAAPHHTLTTDPPVELEQHEVEEGSLRGHRAVDLSRLVDALLCLFSQLDRVADVDGRALGLLQALGVCVQAACASGCPYVGACVRLS